LAEIIREVDGKHDLGAAALAEAILAHPGFSGCHDGPVALPAQGVGEVGELSPREVEAQEAFTQLRDEVLALSDGVEVNEVLGIIDNHTPEWV
jgi:hypothetical protein